MRDGTGCEAQVGGEDPRSSHAGAPFAPSVPKMKGERDEESDLTRV